MADRRFGPYSSSPNGMMQEMARCREKKVDRMGAAGLFLITPEQAWFQVHRHSMDDAARMLAKQFGRCQDN
jgi:hypothetical protein